MGEERGVSSSIQIFQYMDIPTREDVMNKLGDTELKKDTKKHLKNNAIRGVLRYNINHVREEGDNIIGTFIYYYNESYPNPDGTRNTVIKSIVNRFTISYEYELLILHGATAKNLPILKILSVIINGGVDGFFTQIRLSKLQIRTIVDNVLTIQGNSLMEPYFIKGDAVINTRKTISYSLSRSCTTNDPEFNTNYGWATNWTPELRVISCVGLMEHTEPKPRTLRIKTNSSFTLTGDSIPYTHWDRFVFEVFTRVLQNDN